LLVFGAHERN